MFGTAKNRPTRARDFSTHVNEGTEIQGTIDFKGTVLVNGSLTGEVSSSALFVIGPKGVVQAAVRATSIEVCGEVIGDIVASERIDLRSNCRVYGDITAPVIVIDEGALLEGQCRMTNGRSHEPVTADARRDSGIVRLRRQ